MLIFETDEIWTIILPSDFFEIDPSLVTFLDKYPELTKNKLSSDEFPIDKIFHAQTLKEFIVAFVKSEGKIFLMQCLLGDTLDTVVHEVPPAVAANGMDGDITAVRFW